METMTGTSRWHGQTPPEVHLRRAATRLVSVGSSDGRLGAAAGAVPQERLRHPSLRRHALTGWSR